MMKALKMSKVLGTMRKKDNSGTGVSVDTSSEGPEASAARNVKAFCESGGPGSGGDEVLYLPPIVEAAESSPAAAAECARLIRKYLKREFWTKPSFQYNAIMLIRILADNPGPTFTRNLDHKFTDTARELLRSVRDPSVRQMMMETLEAFESTKAYDEGLAPAIDMWKKEKEKAQKKYGGTVPPSAYPHVPQAPHAMNAPPFDPRSQNYFSREHRSHRLPDPVELASRLEEARTSANLLQQVVTNTAPGEILDNELIKEFADRCSSASKSIQGYMQAENPSPDNETMESMIDTNEQLQAALSLHQRSVLNAKKQMASLGADADNAPYEQNGLGIRQPSHSSSSLDAPPQPPRRTNGKGKEREYEPAMAGPSGPSRLSTPSVGEDPFRDPEPETSKAAGKSRDDGPTYLDQEPRLAFEPFHPGFDTTPSYAGRQDSAVGKEAMHGAGVSAVPARKKLPAGVSDEEDDEGLYDGPSTKKDKGQIYRY